MNVIELGENPVMRTRSEREMRGDCRIRFMMKRSLASRTSDLRRAPRTVGVRLDIVPDRR
jgi:hypothetical protein